MRTRDRFTIPLAALLLLTTACSRRTTPVIEEESEIAAAPADPIAARLPGNTLVYARVEGVANLEGACRRRSPRCATPACREARRRLPTPFARGRNNPLGLRSNRPALIGDARSIHLRAVPPIRQDESEPMPCCSCIRRADTVNAVLDDLKTGRTETGVSGARGYRLEKMPPFESAIALDDRTLALGHDAVLANVLASPGSDALGSAAPFQRAQNDLVGRGDAFAYVSIAATKQEIFRDIDADLLPAGEKAKRKEKFANMPFREVGTVAAGVAVDGSFSVLAYTQPGQEFPEFLVRPVTAKKLPARIPADAFFTVACGYDGGKKTRKGFVDWMHEEAKRGGVDSSGMVGALTQNLDRLESDVVIKVKGVAEDLWLAAIPVKTEMAVTIAPDAAGRWGALMAFDIEDRAQAEKLAREIFIAGKAQALPWKQTEHAGLTIHYLDLAEIIKEKGTELPKDVVENVQLQVGYALSDEFFLAGSVELIKFAHRPSGRTLGDALSLKGVDANNTLLYNAQPGAALQTFSKIAHLAEHVQPIARQFPRESSYTLTLTVEKDRAVLRSNVPVSALTAWGVTQFMGARH